MRNLFSYIKVARPSFKVLLLGLTILCLCGSICPASAKPKRNANLIFSDSIRISLLTVSAGPQVYERFGHSGLRVLDLKQKMDVVFHYGVFNFNAPNFVYRFLKGETDYQLGAVYFDYFVYDYVMRGLQMEEQILNLSPEEAQTLLQKLLINYRPENRSYRYSYFFDNCATRPYHLIDNASDHRIQYDTASMQTLTLRDMLQEKTGRNNWLDFGLSLIIAGRADEIATFDEQMFLPSHLMDGYSHATLSKEGESVPFIKETNLIIEGNTETIPQPSEDITWSSPIVCTSLLLLIVALLSFWQYRCGINLHWLDMLLCIIIGIVGLIVWFLNFFSVHPALDHNWNCLWLWPTHLLFAVFIWIKKLKNVVKLYFFINFAALIIYMIISPFIKQHIDAAFIPLILTLIIRVMFIVGWFKPLQRDTNITSA